MDDNGLVTNPLPPETTTPMPPMLHEVYDKGLGWPGDSDREPPRKPRKPHIVLQVNHWPQFLSRMNDAST